MLCNGMFLITGTAVSAAEKIDRRHDYIVPLTFFLYGYYVVFLPFDHVLDSGMSLLCEDSID